MIDNLIKNKKDCMGCYACANICPQNCISMISDEEGFWYPKVEYPKCISCEQCIKVCPIINKQAVQNEPLAYACMNKNEAIRLDSSSGGVFTLIAEGIIEQGGVVFGAGFNDSLQVVHSCVETKEDLSMLRGSKYVQSRVGETYEQARVFLKQNRKVLFSGTPCQIAGLKSFLGKSYDNLLTVDIVCHGVPSPKVFEKYVAHQEKQSGSPARRIAFRLKNEGWKLFSVSFLFKNDTEYRKVFPQDLYMKAFLKDVCLRPSCYACAFKTLHRQSDITMADFWGIKNILPDMDDDKGTSLVFINSKSGKEMFDSLNDKMDYKAIDINEAVKNNPAAIRSASYNPNRNDFFKNLDRYEFDQLVKKYCSDKFQTRIKNKTRRIIIAILRKTNLIKLAKLIAGKN